MRIPPIRTGISLQHLNITCVLFERCILDSNDFYEILTDNLNKQQRNLTNPLLLLLAKQGEDKNDSLLYKNKEEI